MCIYFLTIFAHSSLNLRGSMLAKKCFSQTTTLHGLYIPSIYRSILNNTPHIDECGLNVYIFFNNFCAHFAQLARLDACEKMNHAHFAQLARLDACEKILLANDYAARAISLHPCNISEHIKHYSPHR
jgi:hypothetical protein